MSLTILALNCTLKPAGASSTQRILELTLKEFPDDCEREIVRVAALDIKPGVSSDEGDGDDWPALRRKIDACDILLIGTPIWLGQPASVAKRVLERMDAFLGEVDDQNRTPAYGKVAAIAVVGNERTAPITSRPKSPRPCSTSGTRSQREARPTGSAKPWAA